MDEVGNVDLVADRFPFDNHFGDLNTEEIEEINQVEKEDLTLWISPKL